MIFNTFFVENFKHSIEYLMNVPAVYNDTTISGTFINYLNVEENPNNFEITSDYTGVYKVRKEELDTNHLNIERNTKILINNVNYNIEDILDDETGVITLALMQIELEQINTTAVRRKK